MVHFPLLYVLCSNYFAIIDEYGVEITHSVIRAKTKSFDTVKLLMKESELFSMTK